MIILEEKSQGSGRLLSKKTEVLGILLAGLLSSRTHEEGRPDMQGSG